MRDPIDELSNFDPAADMSPLPPSEIRRRGDRLRRRNQVLAGVGAAAAVALIATPLALLGGERGADGPDPAPSPSKTAEPVATLSEANLLTDDATEFDGQARWRQGDTTTRESGRASDPCLGRPVAELGAEAMFQRTWGLEAHGLSQVIAEFPSAADARVAYDQMTGPPVDCVPRGGEDVIASDGTPATIPVDGEAMVVEATFSLSGQQGGEAFADHRMFYGIAVSGDRLTVLTHDMPDAEYDWGATSPVERMLPAAATRLVGDTSSPDGGRTWPVRLPDNFPLASGLPEENGDMSLDPPSRDNQSMSAARALQACGEVVPGTDPVDRLTTRITDGSTAQLREIQLFADDAAADAYLEAIREVFAACPTEGEAPTITNTVEPGSVGDQSWVVKRASDGIGPGVVYAVRVGNAVFVDFAGNEGDGGAVDDLATVTRENFSDVVAAMYELVDGEASGGDSGSTDPATATGPSSPGDIPDAFPLAAGWPDDSQAEHEDLGLEGPGRSLRPLDHSECGKTYAEPPFADRMIATWSNVEDGRERHLTTYEDADRAVAAVSGLVAFYRACAQGPTDSEGYSSQREVRRTEVGGESWAIVETYTRNENQAVGLTIQHVIRLGRAVLVIFGSNEGGAGPDPARQISSQIDRMTQDAAEPIAAMCRFTEAGC